jgi:2,4-dienoyl-CoA reductase-like NADH-dependent reductase (Old Yellow Enzyme family)
MTPRETLAQPLALPNGTSIPNRIAKASMSEQLGTKENAPTDGVVKLYETWGLGGAGLLLTGNVMIDRRALGEPGNVVLEDAREKATFARWASAAQAQGARAWMQINHPGRQAPRMATKEPVAPSAVPLTGFAGTFIAPRALEPQEIEAIVERFGTTARLAAEAGFAGVQVHGAHGYLISQFLSPRTNLREDAWGGTPEKRRRFLVEVVRAVRRGIGKEKGLGLKLNSADFQRGGFGEEESMDVVRSLEGEGIDLLEISGGTYEQAPWRGKPQRESTVAREAYFLDYAEKVRKVASMPLMLTGGLRSIGAMAGAIASGAVDLVGLARPLALEPDLPRRLMAGETERAISPDLETGIRKLDDFLEASWYQQQIQRMARGEAPDPASCRVSALLKGLVHAFTHRPRPPEPEVSPR